MTKMSQKKYVTIRHLARTVLFSVASLMLCGFNLLTPDKPKLPVNANNPTLIFEWDGSLPNSIIEREGYKDGAFTESTLEAMFEEILTEAMLTWNEIEGSYLVLEWSKSTGEDSAVKIDEEDNIFSLLVDTEGDITVAASARPNSDVSEDNPQGKIITDCDIEISNGDIKANSLLIILVHELGHCLGLGHNHSNYGSIMGYSRTRKTSRLGLDDKSGAIYLYSINGADVETKELIRSGCGVLKGVGNASTYPIMLLILLIPLFIPLIKSTYYREFP